VYRFVGDGAEQFTANVLDPGQAGRVVSIWVATSGFVPWIALPYALALAAWTRVLEAPGMLQALLGASLATTDYR
jgi:hypothetical protein